MTEEDKQWFKGQLDEQSRTLNARINRMEENFNQHKLEMAEKLEAMETRLLTEFHKWASPNDARLRGHREMMRALDLETQALTERVRRLETDLPH